MNAPFLRVENNVVTGIVTKLEREPLVFKWESRTGEQMSMYCTCNACDRIIYTDEMTLEEFNDDERGYCPDCIKETDQWVHDHK